MPRRRGGTDWSVLRTTVRVSHVRFACDVLSVRESYYNLELTAIHHAYYRMSSIKRMLWYAVI